MISNITIGQFVPGDSIIHKLDPRTKIIISFLYIINLFILKSTLGYIMIALFTLGIILASKLKFIYIYRGLKPVFILVLITAIFNIFMVKGDEVLINLGFINIYKEAVILAVKMMVRIVFIVISTSVLTLTTSPIELTDGIEKLLNPFKKFGLPAHELAMMMTIALRFIPTLIDETDKIMKAQKARGADFESGSLIKRAKALIPVLVPLFISSFRRAEELAMAMEARCYRGGEGRTRMKVLKYTKNDAVAYIIMIFVILLSVTSRNLSI
ncbi:energy-coupling factor transporter transmembrane component T family protein [Clostridium cellulovorans]|uniref:Energy-coupling factor transporter transmembrane protein EcfT n=1 Tax=Clostridium cellulovorans (strain ATCC 35296 / DSM 3052 / OCM 3 / 743B) TaxID=573061 RepID=D9SX67_CLOC7|nr:energy-coupling factor transporter transmembrane component T [Clostridium cellulovorans]ADL53370.1 cobalt transport protein [Clostridium cellulovorans 743B]